MSDRFNPCADCVNAIDGQCLLTDGECELSEAVRLLRWADLYLSGPDDLTSELAAFLERHEVDDDQG